VQELHLLGERVVLEHAEVEHQVVFGRALGERVAEHELARDALLLELRLRVAQRLRREVEQRHVEATGLRQREALVAAAAAGFEQLAAVGQ
jgi:hypothetical protein